MVYTKIIQRCNPTDTRRWINVGCTLVHRLRRWTNDKPPLIQRIVSAGSWREGGSAHAWFWGPWTREIHVWQSSGGTGVIPPHLWLAGSQGAPMSSINYPTPGTPGPRLAIWPCTRCVYSEKLPRFFVKLKVVFVPGKDHLGIKECYMPLCKVVDTSL